MSMRFPALKFSVVAISTLLCMNSVVAQTVDITLADVTKKAIEYNPEVQSRWHTFLASGYDINASKAGYRPSVDVNAGYGYEWRNYGPNREFTGGNAEITLTQMLYDGSQTRSEVRHFTRVQLVRYFELLDSVESIALEAVTAYQDVLRYRELVTLAEENLAKHLTVYKQIEESASAGVARAADLEQISGRLSLAESNLVVEIANLHDVSARYLRIVGEAPRQNLAPANLVKHSLPPSITKTLEQAYQTNPSFHASLRNILASEASVDTQKANFRPRLNLSARYGTQDYDQQGFNTTQTEGRIGLDFTYNIYRGGRDQATLRRAYEEVNVAKDLRDKACIDIRQTLQIAFNDTNKIGLQLPVLNQHRLSSDRVRTAYKDQFDIGQRSLLDVLDAENEYFQASRAYNNALYDLSLAVARTLGGMGQLLASIDVVRDGLPTLADLGSEPLQVSPESICPISDINTSISALGDDDNDGVLNYKDQCPNTPITDKVDANGCSIFTETEVSFALNIQFAHNSDIIGSSYMNEVAALAEFLKRFPNTQIEIQGHTSIVGEHWYNQLLSERRAEAVAKVLIYQHNIDKNRVSTIGYAATQLKAVGDTEDAHTQNRRTEAKITAFQKEALPR